MPKIRNALIKAKQQLQVARDRLWSSRSLPGSAELFSSVQSYCMFVGHPRSAHSLVGALLNAHSEIVIAHELDALKYVRAGFSRHQLFRLILRKDAEFTSSGSNWSGYDYSVPGQWQGRYSRLRVMGDKEGARSSLIIRNDPHVIRRLQKLVGIRVCVIHVVRNPFDNIATMLRHGQRGLSQSIDTYFRLCEGPTMARQRVAPADFITLRHESVVQDPRGTVTALCRFLDVQPSAEYLDAAAQRVAPSPRRSRYEAPWTPQAIREVEQRMPDFDFLAGYSYTE